uniref:Uncharacterized protein n=1 Tax=Solanum lycopersicum TaxID=4081 RepID=A0A3Q7FUA3_SOLLC
MNPKQQFQSNDLLNFSVWIVHECIACLVMFFSNIKSEEEQTSVVRRSASAKNLNVELDVCDIIKRTRCFAERNYLQLVYEYRENNSLAHKCLYEMCANIDEEHYCILRQ